MKVQSDPDDISSLLGVIEMKGLKNCFYIKKIRKVI